MTNMRLKWAILVVVLVIAAFYLWPTIRLYAFIDPAEQDSADPSIAQVREKAIRLGLDLRGGSYVVYEVDIDALKPEEQEDAVDRAMEIIRNRVDQFGVAEPVIQKQGDRRIVVQLPGLQDPQRVRELIGKTARLEFRLVKSQQEFLQAMSIVDAAVERLQRAGEDFGSGETIDPGTAETDALLMDQAQSLLAQADSVAGAAADTVAGVADSLLAQADSALAPPPPATPQPTTQSFSSLFVQVPGSEGGYAYCPAENLDEAIAMWQKVAADADKNPKVLAGNTILAWGDTEFGAATGNPGRYIYALTGRPDLTGDRVEDATVAFGLDSTNPSIAGVSMNFDKRGRARSPTSPATTWAGSWPSCSTTR